MAASKVPALYHSVIDDVITSVREIFLDEGVDEQALVELKQVWEKKLVESKAFEHRDPEPILTVGAVTHQAAVHRQSQLQQPTAQISQAIAQPIAISAGSVLQQAVLQYTAGPAKDGQKTVALSGKSNSLKLCNLVSFQGDGQKTVLTMPQKVTITLPPSHSLSQGGLPSVVSGPTTLAALPPEVTATLLQQAALRQGGIISTGQQQAATLHTNDQQIQQIGSVQYQTLEQLQKQLATQTTKAQQVRSITQVDGANDTSDDDEEEDDFRDDDDLDDDDTQNEDDNDTLAEEEDPLNSDDDVSEEDPSDLFDTENVVVCQYDKITRSRNKWKFHLKDGIMSLRGRDFIFQRALGDAEW